MLQPADPTGDSPNGAEQHRLDNDVGRHFGGTRPPIVKSDRDLTDRKTQFGHKMGHLNLKPIAISAHGLEVDHPQGFRVIGAKPRRCIAHLQAQHHCGIEVAKTRDQQAHSRQPLRRAAGDVSRSDCEPSASIERIQQLWNHLGVMRKVSIDLNHGRRASAQGSVESRSIGRTQTLLGRTTQYPHQLIGDTKLLDQIGCTVRGVVIDDQYRRQRHGVANTTDQVDDVTCFVVGWNDHPRVQRHRSTHTSLLAQCTLIVPHLAYTAGNLTAMLAWMDLEMTGLAPERHVIIEIAMIITDDELNVVSEFGPVVIHASENELAEMEKVVINMHEANGLLADVRQSTTTLEEATEQALTFLKHHCPNARQVPLCGNSIGTDRRFLAKYMPEVENWLHYRSVDVSSIKELAKRWYPGLAEILPAKDSSHRALDDIRDSIAELQFYREQLFVKNPTILDAHQP